MDEPSQTGQYKFKVASVRDNFFRLRKKQYGPSQEWVAIRKRPLAAAAGGGGGDAGGKKRRKKKQMK